MLFLSGNTAQIAWFGPVRHFAQRVDRANIFRTGQALTLRTFHSSKRIVHLIFALGIVGLVGACATPEPGTLGANNAFDPYEVENRKIHNFNKTVDRAVLRPVGRGYQTLVPIPVQDMVSNFSDNLSMPGNAVNGLLQGDLKGTGLAVSRFAMNTTIGIGGLIDAATEFGVPDYDTDFGETLHVWGAGEGAYVELPLLGPSTVRDATGRAVDLFTNPLGYFYGPKEKWYAYGARVATNVGDRGRFGETIDYILYDSADSYAQTRLIYLQNRRFELGVDAGLDPTDPYGDPYGDFSTDPYEDPYAE